MAQMAFKLNKFISASEVRQTFLDYFKSKNHSFVPSTSVLCGTGHGTYFTNAGMNQFRSIFEADNLPPNHPFANIRKAVNSQRCIRMNDLGDVGRDGYHHTIFEMLGTWVFGLENKSDSKLNRISGKKEAIYGAWDLLTNVFRLDKSRLSVTYFAGDPALNLGPDNETRDLWRQLGLHADKIVPAGSESNFWTMGEMGGPCGPCTEIHYATGAPDGGPWPAILELWNIVFINYSRDSSGFSRRLPRSHIDTGLGLERLTAVLNSKSSNYSSDVFTSIFSDISSIYKLPPYEDVFLNDDDINFSYRVIADHARMATVAIADGVLPSNRDLGHKVRSVLTRAFCQIVTAREDSLSNLHQTFPQLSSSVLERSPVGLAFPELLPRLPAIKAAMENEALRFASAWNAGKRVINSLKNQSNFAINGQLNPEVACKLLDGSVPSMSLELLMALARNCGLKAVPNSIKHLLAKQQTNKSNNQNVHSRMGAETTAVPAKVLDTVKAQQLPPTSDAPQYTYNRLKPSSPELPLYNFPPCEASVLAIFPSSSENESCWVLLDRTNLHASNLGGQASDFGSLELKGSHSRYPITLVQQLGGFNEPYILHRVETTARSFVKGSKVLVYVDEERRQAIMRAHTACHLTMAAVRKLAKDLDASELLCSGTMQAGSNVEGDRFTIDIQTPLQLTDADYISKLQNVLNHWVGKETCQEVKTTEISIDEASKSKEIIRLPNEEYPPVVRLVKIGDTKSQELCCGTHVKQTSDIMAAVIMNATGGRQGVKRLTIVTGPPAISALCEGTRALEHFNNLKHALGESELPRNTLNDVLRNLAMARRLIDSATLPRVVRDKLFCEIESLNKSAINHSTSCISKALNLTKDSGVQVIQLAWRSLRTETTRSIIRAALKQHNLKTPVIFADIPYENAVTMKPKGVMCVLPRCHDEKFWDPLVKEFKLRIDEKKAKNCIIVDGTVPHGSLNDFHRSVAQIFVSFREN